ncbi:MAG: UDP-N-acetylmuramoyl-tripeptide--D-alanyl-D-alanine ligase [Lachnospiraceae bacterium]|nr:UDP-N-acetylmuramoyl-tripeptide--D-alanyl-D-alanine ligase [Lachnospiraceae bacterium]
MIWLDLFLLILTCVTGAFVLRYNVHMFQLNGYKNREHLNRLKKSAGKQGILFALPVFGIPGLFIKAVPVYIPVIILLLITLRYYLYLREINTKKKLVYTNRVKRLLVTEALLSAAVLLCGWLLFERRFFLFSCTLSLVLQILLPVAGNLINHPVESAINRHYIYDAKRILGQNPDLVIIGITGSYGKTSMKYYLNTLLSEHFDVLITPESFNTPMGVVRTIREHMTPRNEIFLCEMGARHVGDIRELCDLVHPKHGIITSVGPQHLETFFTIENVVNTKFELADALPEDGMLILNGDNELIREKGTEYRDPVYYSTEDRGGPGNPDETAGYRAEKIRLSRTGTEFTVVTPEGEEESFSMRLIGAHNVINVLGAITTAHKLGVPLRKLKTAVRRLLPVEHRMKMIPHGNYTIIDDAYNSNPAGSKAAVETLSMFEGQRILITPGMVELGEKEEEFNYRFGTYAAACCDYVFLVGRKHTEPILKGLTDSGFDTERAEVFDRIEDALSRAYNVKGEGHKYILLENDLPDNY